MHSPWRRSAPWLLGWAALALAGSLALLRWDIAQRREAFQTDARIAHRLLSQRAVQQEAILATLALLSPPADGIGSAEARLPAVYPQVLAVLRRDGRTIWPDPALQASEVQSRTTHHAVLGPIDATRRQYTLVLAGDPSSFALRIDVQRMVPWDTWPLARDGPVRATLVQGTHVIVLQPGAPVGSRPAGLTEGFRFAKTLDAAGQPFELQLQRATGPAEWPWLRLLGWMLFSAVALTAWRASLQAIRERRRAVKLLRVGQIARLNTMGELAGGMAHELNQPLTAVLANTQAASRLLDDDPPALADARRAMAQAAAQARRVADVVTRMRRLVETPDTMQPRQAVNLETALRGVMELLEPEIRRHRIQVSIRGQVSVVDADPVALEQIMHNLIGNAMQALDDVPIEERRLILSISTDNGQGVLSVRDTGPGIGPDAMPHVFDPFYTTRRGGLGLGLSLCESLAQRMKGTLNAHNAPPRGAEFRLALPLARSA
ncbi:MAG: ATP-binding protein [Ideonella sp.]